jgi:hypothetical protein
MRLQADWMDVGMIIDHRCKRVTWEDDSDLIWAGQRLHFELMEIQPTTEYTFGNTPGVGTKAGALHWICIVNLRKESDKKTSDEL